MFKSNYTPRLGDRIVAVNMNSGHSYLGKQATVVDFHGGLVQLFDGDPGTHSYFWWRFELAEPDTPFNRSLRTYISKELHNGG